MQMWMIFVQGGGVQEHLPMHPNQGKVCIDIWTDGISTIPDYPNILTWKSVAMNNAPRNPLYGPVTWDPARKRPNLRFVNAISISTNTTITVSTPPLCKDLTHWCVIYIMQAPSSASAFSRFSAFPIWLSFPDSTQILRSNQRFLIWLPFSDPTPIFRFESSHARVSLKLRGKIVEYWKKSETETDSGLGHSNFWRGGCI